MNTTRRDFLKSTAAIGAGLYLGAPTSGRAAFAANEKLDLACVGVGGRGYADLRGVSSENIVAMADADDRQAARAYKKFPQAATYRDYRKLLDRHAPKLDGVVIATPDHVHVPAAVDAMERDLPVYVEKPLGHNVWEVRYSTELARKKGLATQLGTQIHAGDNYRRVVEAIQAGAIGPIKEVHVFVAKDWGGPNRNKPLEPTPPVPEELSWNIWLGPAEKRPYADGYLPGDWRRWWDFGSGTLGDMGCHYMDLVYWALGLKYPTKITAEGPEPSPVTAPHGVKVTYEFPKTAENEAVTMTWTDGNMVPKTLHDVELPGAGVLFVGEKGKLLGQYHQFRLYPEEQFADWQPPEQTIPPSVGHHEEWIQAVKTGSPTTCDFDYSGPLTETVLLGCVSYRTGHALEWDAENLRVTNDVPGAEELIRPAYREGWRLV